ncbi:uncharacterized protein [Venturia canescens]|uniref:uncharacterized protein n=1 Tax=Venturia canescens TaxID=32260 RepID=UPI001C9BC7F9|nr:uncharacterized protein LOC122413536 [Venturia canescens]
MDAKTSAKFKQWVDAIAAEDIAGVTTELERYLDGNVLEETMNKILFKLLQHLSHGAYKYDRSKTKLGSELARLADFICSKMTTALSAKKFFSSIYHITACLVGMNLYCEGMAICDYILPTWGLCEPDETLSKHCIFEPASALWHRAALNILKNMESLNHQNYKLFMSIVEYDLKLVKIWHNKLSQDYFTRILWYSKKIMPKVDKDLLDEYKKSILELMRNSEITLNDDNSENIWNSICELIPVWIGKDLNSTSIDSIVKSYSQYFDLFRRSIMANEKYSYAFTLWERLCEILLKRVDDFRDDCDTEIDRWLKEFNDWCRLDRGAVLKPYCYAIVQLLTSVVNYWEEYTKRKDTTEHVTSDMIAGILKLSEEHGRFFSTFAIRDCRCQKKNCKIKTDVCSELVLKIKCLVLISRCSKLLASEKVQKLSKRMMESSFELLKSLKSANCEEWTLLWPTLGGAIYNMGVICENTFPDQSICLYENLIASTVFLVGVKSVKRLWGLDDALGTILHRLWSVCMKNQRYERAKKIASINCLLSHDIPETKAYKDWSSIKHKESTATKTTLLEYLRNNELEIPQVNVDDYDLIKVCLREIKALQESQLNLSTSIMAVLDELENLQAKSVDYVQGVQLLSYHSLNFDTNLCIEKYLQKAISMYKQETTVSSGLRCAYAMIKFYEFVEKTREFTRNTEADMKIAIRALTGGFKNAEQNGCNEYDVVPAYRAINMTVTCDLESSLKEALIRWQKLVNSNGFEDLTDWEIRYSLHAIKIAGEYCRLYHFEYLEDDAWKMVYKIAIQISDSLSILYVTSRSITSPNIHIDWIVEADQHAGYLENSNDRQTMKILMRYKLCLAKLYYDNNEIEKADELFLQVASNKEMIFLKYLTNFLLLKEIEMKYRLGRDENDDQSTYTTIIIQYLYTLLSIDDGADTTIYGRKEEQLYNYEILLDYTNSLTLPMNSLLSYREISAHLVKRLSTAQKLVASLRVAECLKYLCYIDLSRAQLEDCAVKLQGLEHILEIEALEATMQSDLLPCRDYKEFPTNLTNVPRHVDAVRDVGQSDTSPVLRKKVFAKPQFMLDGDICSCFKCTNFCYQYLVFASTHIRAQLFAMQKNEIAAFQHFHGAMEIKKCILMKRRAVEAAEKNHKFLSSCPQHQRHIIEYVMFHLDYCHFLESSMPDSTDTITNIALDALELCNTYNLHNHPLYVTVNEFLFQRRFHKLFTNRHYSKFMVPDVKDMDVSRYDVASVQDAAICVTPVRDVIEKRPPIPVRRRKTPPFLSLDRVPPFDSTNDLTTPTLSVPAVKTRRLRRKISKDYDEGEEEPVEKSEEPSIPAIKITVPDRGSTKGKNSSNRTSSSKRDVVEKLHPIEGENSSLAEMTKMLEKTEIDGKSRARIRKKEKKIALPVENSDIKSTKSNKSIDQVTKLFDDMSMKKEQKSDRLLAARSSQETKNTSNNSAASAPQTLSFPTSALSDTVASSETGRSEPARRVSSRLRNRDKSTGQTVSSRNSEISTIIETNNRENVVAVGPKTRRRLYASKETNCTDTNKIVKSSRTRTTKSQDG